MTPPPHLHLQDTAQAEWYEYCVDEVDAVEFEGCDKGVADLSKDHTVWVDEDGKTLKPIRKWWQDECIFKVRDVISAPPCAWLCAF